MRLHTLTALSCACSILVTALIPACSRYDSGGTKLDLSHVQSQRDHLCVTFDATTIERCDRSTFHVLMAAMCKQDLPVQYESPAGKWNRDVEPCYPEDSRSETSRDAYLSVVLSKDKDAIARIIAFAGPQNWETGAPSGNVGNIAPLVPLLRGYSLAGESDAVVDEAIQAAQNAFTGHRGHLIAGYMWATARLRGGLTPAGRGMLQKLHSATPESPYLSCLAHRFSRVDNDQHDTIRLLYNMPHSLNTFGWGSSVWPIHYALTVACLEGR